MLQELCDGRYYKPVCQQKSTWCSEPRLWLPHGRRHYSRRDPTSNEWKRAIAFTFLIVCMPIYTQQEETGFFHTTDAHQENVILKGSHRQPVRSQPMRNSNNAAQLCSEELLQSQKPVTLHQLQKVTMVGWDASLCPDASSPKFHVINEDYASSAFVHLSPCQWLLQRCKTNITKT